MDLLRFALSFFRRNAPETLLHLDPPDTVSWEDFRDAIREKRALQMERDTYKALLLQGGETERTLDARVRMHKRTLLKAVQAA